MLRDLHSAWAWVVVAANGLAGSWALAAHRWEYYRTRWLWWFTAAAEVAIVLQVVLGVAVMDRRDDSPAGFHMFYGFMALAGVGILYSYRQQLASRRYLLYGFGGLFLMGLALRAIYLDPAAGSSP